MHSNDSELQFFAGKLVNFLSKIHEIFKFSTLEEKLKVFVGDANHLVDMVFESLEDRDYNLINEVGLKIFNDPFANKANWWLVVDRYLMRYPFYRQYCNNKFLSVEASKFVQFCCLSVVYGFSDKREDYSSDFLEVASKTKNICSFSNFKYFLTNTFHLMTCKFYLFVIFMILFFTDQYGFSTLAPLAVYEPSFLYSLVGSPSSWFVAISLVYFFYLMQKDKKLWGMFFESSTQTDKLASYNLGVILIGSCALVSISSLVSNMSETNLNSMVLNGKYEKAVERINKDYFSSPIKQSYLLSQVYFNAYTNTNIEEYKFKGLIESQKFLSTSSHEMDIFWAVPNVVREMNERLMGLSEAKYWYTTSSIQIRKNFILCTFIAGLYLILFGVFDKFRQSTPT